MDIRDLKIELFFIFALFFPYQISLACTNPKFHIQVNFKNHINAAKGGLGNSAINAQILSQSNPPYKLFIYKTKTQNTWVVGAPLAMGLTKIKLCELDDGGAGQMLFTFKLGSNNPCTVTITTSKTATDTNNKKDNPLQVIASLELTDTSKYKCFMNNGNPYIFTMQKGQSKNVNVWVDSANK